MSKPWLQSAIVTTIAGVSLACFGGTPEHIEVFEPGAPQPVVVEPAPDVAPVPVPVAIPVIDDELEFIGRMPAAAYSNAWLVIVASTATPEPIPPAVFEIEEKSGGLLAADRLDSGHYKGLMPCWSIAIAGAATERAVATEMLALLTSHGVDGYIKNAGEYVGDDPRVQAVCEDMRSDSANQCPADAYMTQVIDGRWHLQVSVPPEVAEAAMAGAPSPRPVTPDKHVWTAPLRVETLGDVGVGDTFFIDELSGTHSVGQCTVTGFSAVTQGMPHFSYGEFGDGDKPGCGTPQPWAILDCGLGDRSGFGVATTRVDTAESWRPRPETGANRGSAAAAIDTAMAHPEFRSAKAAAQSTADEQQETLNEEIIARAFTGPSGDGFVVTIKWWTRDGFAFCGGDDVLVSRTAGIVDGRARTGVADTSYADFLGVVEFGAEPTAQVVTRPMFGGVNVGHEDTQCGITIDFCDCGC